MSLTACPQCGQQVPPGQRTCPHCGASQTFSTAIKFALLGLIAACLAATAYGIARSHRSASDIGSNIPIDHAISPDVQMREVAQFYVKQVLQAPNTAKFAPKAEWDVTPIDKASSRMHAWVDSKNASGATLRASFTVAVQLNKDTASLLYLQFDDDDKPIFGVRPLTEDERKRELKHK